MCGITGFIDFSCNTAFDDGIAIARSMSQAIFHRGPNDHGIWCDSDHGVFLAHQRLSIVDLSSAGHQPMLSPTGRYAIVFNGEIYNHMQIKRELDINGVVWRGSSDTEVILAAIECWGLDVALQKFEGMFAFALWDRKNSSLILARDRFGEKPLYWGKFGNTLLFGSELKALKKHPAFMGAIDRSALSSFISYGYITGNGSIYQGIERIPPGSTYIFEADGSFASNKYWSSSDAALTAMNHAFEGSALDAINKLESLVTQSIRQQLLADVPVGAFLSGGIDSSTIVALAQAQSSVPVKTFTIGFDEIGFNEAPYADKIAKYLGTDHTEHYISHKDVLNIIPDLPTLYDEPFADPSQIPTYLVSKLARTKVVVSLSGDGGDELFCGYNRYAVANKIRRWTSPQLFGLIKSMSAGLTKLPMPLLNVFGSSLQKLGLASSDMSQFGEKIHKFAKAIAASGSDALLYESLIQSDELGDRIVTGLGPVNKLTDSAGWLQKLDLMHRMMLLDTVSYLTDDILVKVDRASMGVSLESRVPFLDHKIYEFAWSLPLSMKVRDGKGKWLLRQVLYRYVPKSIIERKKVGFSVPLAIWLRGPLKAWGMDLLDEHLIRKQGFFNPALVHKMWVEHQQGSYNHEQLLWRVLMFQAWLSKND